MIEGVDPRTADVATAFLDALSAHDPDDPGPAALALARLETYARDEPGALLGGAFILADSLLGLLLRRYNGRVDRQDLVAQIRPLFDADTP